MDRLILGTFLAGLWVVSTWAGEVVSQKVDLLEVIKAGEVEFHLNPTMDVHDDPKDVWTFGSDGVLNVSGRGYGYVGTKKTYRDYHLVLEFKWGTKTWGAREKKAKDNGVLLHGYGPHGAYGGTWMASIEAQIIEGGVGDILVLSPKLADGTELTTSLSAEFGLDRDKEKIWKKGEPRQVVTKGRINWRGRDEDWADRVGFRGREDVESPAGEWNRLEVIAKGDTLQYFVNGALVNEAFDCKPSEGKVLLQTEGAEMIVRRYELWPLGAFEEKWSAIQASGGSDVTVRDGQERALSAEESMKLIQLDGPYEVQLVACEPLVLDPVECTWDEKGRMFVADMRDYPLGPPKAGDPWLSRIQMLTDEDGDGRMDKAVTFADHLDNVQGLLPFDGGLIATTRSQILFLKDSNGDDVADVMKPLIRGFNPKHSQLQVSAPRWGPDGCVHFNNGLEAKEIYPADAPDKVVGVPGSNFKWDPRTGAITPTGGKGQYGGAFDDWGHHFYCSNRNPVMFTVMPYEAMTRNPHAGITQNYEDIALPGAATRVYPLKITHTTADAHAGTNTACSGLGVYRGGLMPELRNNVFVPDPTGQLVTRYRVEPNGASLKATRVGERTEFFRSGDEWSRPVNFTTGPDGAIYICDIYRRWIDHARFFPEEFVKTHDMRQGENEGRIWRVVPKGTKKLVPKTLGQNQVMPKGDWGDLPKEYEGRIVLDKLLLKVDVDDHPDSQLIGIRTEAICQYPDDPWMAKAALASSTSTAGYVLAKFLADERFTKSYSIARNETVRTFAASSVVRGLSGDLEQVLTTLKIQPGKLLWWKPALLQGLAKLPKGHAEAEREIGALQSKIDAIVMDAEAPLEQRLAVLPLLGSRKWAAVEPVMRGLLLGNPSAELSGAAVALLKRFAATSTAPLIYELLPKVGPAVKRELVPILTGNATTALALFKRMEKGEFPTAWVDVETRWKYQRGAGEMAVLAKKLFGEASGDRAGVVTAYLEAAKTLGDAKRGEQVFASICIACHKHGAMGVDVGPPLSDVKVKPPEGLLSDILDPNRMFEARWSAYAIETKDGRALSGLIQSETSDSVVLAMMGGAKETISRSDIKEMKSLDRTLMPDGLEAAITKEQMADLLAFLGGK
jgi:putative membrane-bound dehydrogenase-like protein